MIEVKNVGNAGIFTTPRKCIEKHFECIDNILSVLNDIFT